MLKQIKLNNFRNYPKLEINFQEGLNVILGENASGKTNLLEAIAFIGILKSFRNVTLPQLIHENSDVARVELETDEDLFSAAWTRESNARKLEINNKKSKTTDFIKKFPVVIFAPDDLLLLTGEPSLRRRFLDSLCVRLEPSFALILNEYKKTLRHRNILLKQNADPEQLTFWETKIVQNGWQIWQKRQDLIQKINAKITQNELELIYETENIPNSEDDFAQKLFTKRERDRLIGRTTFGPHRDDWTLNYKNKNLRFYGSRGEQRTAIINLKTAEAQILENQNSKKPLLLLDDILSELDISHQKHIAELISDYQTILTTTQKPPLDYSQIILAQNGEAKIQAA